MVTLSEPEHGNEENIFLPRPGMEHIAIIWLFTTVAVAVGSTVHISLPHPVQRL